MGKIENSDAPIDHADFPVAYCRAEEAAEGAPAAEVPVAGMFEAALHRPPAKPPEAAAQQPKPKRRRAKATATASVNTPPIPSIARIVLSLMFGYSTDAPPTR